MELKMDSTSDLNKKRFGTVEPWVGLVYSDSEVMGGMPVFVGTRIPVENIIASLDRGLGEEQVLAAYPSLTHAHVEAAIAYAARHSVTLPVRRLSELNPTWVVKSCGIARRAKT